MAVKIGVTNQKGGVGKTTLTFHLAHLFSKNGKRVLLVDMDPQGNLTSCFIKELPDKSNAKIMFEEKVPEPVRINENLSIIGSDIALSKYEADAKLTNFFRLKNVLEQEDKGKDIILIDTPPSLGLFTSNVLIASDYILIPIDISRFSLLGLSDLLDSIESVKESTGSKINILGIVFTIASERLNYYKEIKEEIKSKYGNLLFDTAIPESVRVKEAIGNGKPIFDMYPDHKASLAYKKLFKEMEARLNANG